MNKTELIQFLDRVSVRVPNWNGPVFHPAHVAEMIDIPEHNVNSALLTLDTLPAHGDTKYSDSESLRCRIFVANGGGYVPNHTVSKMSETYAPGHVVYATVSGVNGLMRNYALDLYPVFCEWANAQKPAPPVRRHVENRVLRLETAVHAWINHVEALAAAAGDTHTASGSTISVTETMRNMLTGCKITEGELENSRQVTEQWVENLQKGDFKQANDALLSLNDKCRPKPAVSFSVREAAQLVGAPEKTFVRWLLQKKIMYRNGQNNLAAYSHYLLNNYFTVVEVPYYVSEGDARVSCRTRFTQEGLAWLKDQAWT